MTWLIYKITNNKNGRSYIGLTGGALKKRWKEHCTSALYNKKITGIGRAINKYGAEHFSIVEITRCETEREASVCERGLIAAHGTYTAAGGYNMTLGGETPGGRLMRFEDRQCLSKLLKGRKKKMTPEGSAKLAALAKERFKGKKKSPQHAEKYRRYIAENPEKMKADRAKGGASRVWDAEARANLGKSIKAAHARPEVRAKMAIAIKAAWAREDSVAGRKSIGDKKKAWYANPENMKMHREKARAGRLRYLENQRAKEIAAQGAQS